ncbi:MAG: MoxR family ATPase [Verrucomicrobiota bacterium]
MNSPNPSPAVPTEEDLAPTQDALQRIRDELNGVLFGQEPLIDLVLIGLLSRGHLLLEGLPGLGKTELVKALSTTLGLESKRIQFTPDLLPGDITGNPILEETGGQRQFRFQPGPLFSHLCLADEINRASPKTQSALLEAMQERRVTVLGETHPLPDPFFVLATQNPIELEGTYPLPEAQLDRFLFKLVVPVVDAATLQRIVEHRELGTTPTVSPVVHREEWRSIQEMARRIFLPEAVAEYIARLVHATQPGESSCSQSLRFGASPRAALSFAAASKARALLHGRVNASFEDIRLLAEPILAHRITLDYAAKMEGTTAPAVVQKLLQEIPAQAASLPPNLREQ